ncbi:hypothetical protein [Streptosporangium sp. NPDC002721]|uniref:WXG100-like domain-containing protein n=1 Tax=Streptosporangium sp. NPDC002721 TaxID=3366188 RepID=UPI0036ABD20A
MSRLGAAITKNPFMGAMGIGSLGSAAFVTSMLGVSWPEGDPDKLRAAADIWDGLADTVERTGNDANGVAEQVWKNNGGAAVGEFRTLWTGTFRPYPGEVAKFCRAIAQACRDYAHAVEVTRYVLIVLAIQAWANMVFTVAWGWGTAYVGAAVQKQIMDRFFKGRAILQMKLFKISVEKIIYNSFYYLGDSLGYAGGQQAIQWFIFDRAGVEKDLTGNDVTGAGENFKQFARGFASNIAFNGAYDLTKINSVSKSLDDLRVGFNGALDPTRINSVSKPLDDLRALLQIPAPNQAVSNLLSRLVGSTMYTVADNTLQGDPGLPSMEQMLAKILVHGSRTLKPPT